MSKRALILGVGGQDGSYLADILLERGYQVSGLYRHSSVDNLARIAHCRDRINLIRGDILDPASLANAVENWLPDEVYHVADQDNVRWSKDVPSYQVEVTVKGVLNLLDAYTTNSAFRGTTKVFVPSSSTIYGDAPVQQAGDWPLDPRTPYAIAKAAVLHLCRYYRREYGLQVYCGIMYGHDSPRRGPDYLLQKIARGEEIGGDLSKQVDIGYAREFMEGVVGWLDRGEPGEEVFRTGRTHMISELLKGEEAISSSNCVGRNRYLPLGFLNSKGVLKLIKESLK